MGGLVRQSHSGFIGPSFVLETTNPFSQGVGSAISKAYDRTGSVDKSGGIGWDYVSQVLLKHNQLWFGRLAVVRIDPLEAAQYVLSPTLPLRAMDSIHLHAANTL